MPDLSLEQFPVTEEVKDRLDALYEKFSKGVKLHLGFPANTLYDYSALNRFFEFTVNNVGDPFADGVYEINTHAFEREVIAFFAELYHSSIDSHWGHVTHGGTEGNMYGLYIAREQFPDGIVYYSEAAHYGIAKIVRFMRLPHVVVASQENGEMDYDALEREVTSRKQVPIVIATIGTTMTGAVDRPERVVEILDRNHMYDSYIHCDSALGGMILPFLDDAPTFDFRLPIGSISVSGHKMIGSPVPCGLVLANKAHVDSVTRMIEMIGAPDTTISGSRNGHSVLFLWYAIQRFGFSGFKHIVNECMAVKRHAMQRFTDISWPVSTEPYTVTIVIKRPPMDIVKKWQLAVQGDTAHVIIMPNITRGKIDAFVQDLVAAKGRT